MIYDSDLTLLQALVGWPHVEYSRSRSRNQFENIPPQVSDLFWVAAVNPEPAPESCSGLNARSFSMLPQGGARPQLLNANRAAFISGIELRFNF